MTSLKDMVKDGQQVHFTCYSKGELWYRTDSGFEFPVPLEDVGDAIFLRDDKALLFMRYIRKHLNMIEQAKHEELMNAQSS